MVFSTRIFAFYDHGATSLEEAFQGFDQIPEMTHVDLNYPEHFNGLTTDDVNALLARHNLKPYGVSMRFRKEFLTGDYGNPDVSIADRARQLTRDAVDACVAIHGENLTIYLENDGFDYCFQLDYARAFDEIVRSVREGCRYALDHGLKVSFEYKPYEPRRFMMIDSFGMTMYLLEKVGIEELGVTLDYCHMLMKKENPACGLAIALAQNKVTAIHLNDGWGRNDAGMMLGGCTPNNMLEFVYYLKKYNFDGMVFFDTFPIIEDPVLESRMNIRLFRKMWDKLDEVGMDRVESVIRKNDAIAIMDLLSDIYYG